MKDEEIVEIIDDRISFLHKKQSEKVQIIQLKDSTIEQCGFTPVATMRPYNILK